MSHPGKDNEDKIANEAKPDDLSRPAIAIDLGEDVTKDITQGENNYSRRKDKETNAYYLYSNNISCD